MIENTPRYKDTTKELIEQEMLNKSVNDRIDGLIKTSRYSNGPTREINCDIKNEEGDSFKIKMIEDGNGPEFKNVYSLMKDTFTGELIGSYEMIKSAVDGKTPWGTARDKFRAVSIYDEKNELSAACLGSVLNKKDSSNEMIYYMAYIATNPDIKKSGLARELYISALMDANKIADENNKKIIFSMGECTSSSEAFWNSMGEKRIYIKKDEKFTELPYISPALVFNKLTGEVVKNNSEMPLHLMVDSFGDKKINRNDIVNICETIITSEMWPREAFLNNEAYKTYVNYVDNLKNKFIKAIDMQGEIVLLSKEERENLQKKFIFDENIK